MISMRIRVLMEIKKSGDTGIPSGSFPPSLGSIISVYLSIWVSIVKQSFFQIPFKTSGIPSFGFLYNHFSRIRIDASKQGNSLPFILFLFHQGLFSPSRSIYMKDGLYYSYCAHLQTKIHLPEMPQTVLFNVSENSSLFFGSASG